MDPKSNGDGDGKAASTSPKTMIGASAACSLIRMQGQRVIYIGQVLQAAYSAEPLPQIRTAQDDLVEVARHLSAAFDQLADFAAGC